MTNLEYIDKNKNSEFLKNISMNEARGVVDFLLDEYNDGEIARMIATGALAIAGLTAGIGSVALDILDGSKTGSSATLNQRVAPMASAIDAQTQSVFPQQSASAENNQVPPMGTFVSPALTYTCIKQPPEDNKLSYAVNQNGCVEYKPLFDFPASSTSPNAKPKILKTPVHQSNGKPQYLPLFPTKE